MIYVFSHFAPSFDPLELLASELLMFLDSVIGKVEILILSLVRLRYNQDLNPRSNGGEELKPNEGSFEEHK